MAYFLQGLTLGLAYVAPIGLQNLFVINTALTQKRSPEGLSCYMAAIGCERGLLEKAENSGVPETLCSYHKLLMGLAESDVIPRPSFVLNTTLACDANQLTFRRLSEYYGTPPFCTGCSLPRR